MSVAKVALPSSVVVSLAPSSPNSFSCAFQTATFDCPWIEAPLGNALKIASPGVALLIARMLAQRLNIANTYLADIKQQYAGHGNHLAMVGDLLQSMINLPPTQVSPGSDRQSDPRI